MLRTGPGGHPQEPEPGRVPGLVLGREMRVVVNAGVDQTQRDEPPVDGVVALRLHLPHPFARHPGERADRVEIEIHIGIHTPALHWGVIHA